MGGESARSRVCHTMDEVRETVAELGLPVVVRPSFTMGGLGSGMAYDDADLERIAGGGLAASPTANVLIEESILGWKEYELELMRDNRDNVVVICSIENVDPVGVHTGDSVTVAPAMTLTDVEYQKMRDLSIAILREVGVDTGGCNIQFAQDPRDGRLVVIEMNPRVSRSSALASKATGFPIAKIAAKLAIGYSLDEIVNDITKETRPASSRRWTTWWSRRLGSRSKFPGADPTLTTTMKSVGEAMSLGRSFAEALGKVMRSLETTKAAGSGPRPAGGIRRRWTCPRCWTPQNTEDGRLYGIMLAFDAGATVEQLYDATAIDPWFLAEIQAIGLVALGSRIRDAAELDAELLRRPKAPASPTARLPRCVAISRMRPRCASSVSRAGVRPVYKTVDTCAAEFEAKTPYHYSSYGSIPRPPVRWPRRPNATRC